MTTKNLKSKLERALTDWDRRCNRRNHHAGAIALRRLDECVAEIEAGKPVEHALRAHFQDRLLTRMLKAAGLPDRDPGFVDLDRMFEDQCSDICGR